MLTAEQKRLVAEEAATRTRLSWGRTNPRRLGGVLLLIAAAVYLVIKLAGG